MGQAWGRDRVVQICEEMREKGDFESKEDRREIYDKVFKVEKLGSDMLDEDV